MTDASGTTTYTYDNVDRLLTKAAPAGTLSYSYDNNGNVKSLQSSNANGASVAYTYDALNRLASVTDNRLPSGQNTTTYSYDPVSNLITATYPNGVNQTLSYDSLNRLTGSTSPARSFTYSRAATGDIESVLEGSGRGDSYGYDNVWRLLLEGISSDPAGHNGTLNYGLDPVGNRLSLSSTFSQIAPGSFTYNANDQTNGETYDANGNLLASGANAYTWDFENRLKSFNGGTVTMVYDGDGSRVAKTVGSSSTAYLVDDLNPTGYSQVVEEIAGGAVQRVYTYGVKRISELQTITNAWTPSFYGYDGEGHVRFLTNAASSSTDIYDYDNSGNLIASTGSTPNVYLYRGEQWDQDLSLYNLRARWYKPATGRFLSRDPLDNGNKYTYAGSDPVNLSDPSGQDFAGISTYKLVLAVGVLTAATGVAIYENGHGTSYSFNPIGADFVCIMGAAASSLEQKVAKDGLTTVVVIVYNGQACKTPKKKGDPLPDPTPLPQPQPKPRKPGPDDPDEPQGPTYVVRGGQCNPGGLIEGSAEHKEVPGLYGFSVQSAPGKTIAELAATGQFRNPKICVTTLPQLLSIGSPVVGMVPTPGRGYHNTVVISPAPLTSAGDAKIRAVFTVLPNPAPFRP